MSQNNLIFYFPISNTLSMEQTTSRAMTLPTDFSPAHWQAVKEMCNTFIKSGALPAHIRNAETAMMIVQAGTEMGIPPMQALSTLYPVNGKIAMEGKAMLKKLRQGRVKVEWIESTDTKCSVTLTRPDDQTDKHTETFTIEDAQRAGLLGKDNWKKYPKDMLRWKALSRASRFHCPDISEGLYLLEEVADFEDSHARWTDSGVVIEAMNPTAERVINAMRECQKHSDYVANILPEINENGASWTFDERRAVNQAVEEKLKIWNEEKKKSQPQQPEPIKKIKVTEHYDDGKPVESTTRGEISTEEDSPPDDSAETVFEPDDEEFRAILTKVAKFQKQTKLIEFIHDEWKPMVKNAKQEAAMRRAAANQIEAINGKRPTEEDMRIIFG